MAKVAAGIAVALVVVLALTQIFIPRFAEGQVEDRLTDDGGSAEVDITAWPALTLLWGDGRKFKAEGEGMDIELSRDEDPLEKLDKFEEVDIRLRNLTAGPVEVRTFGLERGEDDSTYYLRMDATSTMQQLAEQAGEFFGGSLGSSLGGFAGGLLPGGGTAEVPIDVEGQLARSPDGTIDVDGVNASVAGLPAGPFAEMIVQSVLDQL